MEMIKIEEVNGEQLVSARELYEFLGVKTKYIDWFNRMCEYGFSENVDFTTVSELSQKKEGSRTVKRQQLNHLLKINMAKELSMIQRTEKGKQAREYFIKCEEAWNSEEMILARALQIQNKKVLDYKKYIAELEEINKEKTKEIEELKPFKDYVDEILSSEEALTITQIAADYDKTAIWLNKVLKDERVIRKVNNQWILYKDKMGKGYTVSETVKIKKNDGSLKVVVNTKWTQKGRLMIHELLKKYIEK